MQYAFIIILYWVEFQQGQIVNKFIQTNKANIILIPGPSGVRS